MMSGFCRNLVDLASRDHMSSRITSTVFSRVKPPPRIFDDLDGYERDGYSEMLSYEGRRKNILVANFLPVHAQKNPESGEWCFSFNEDELLLQMKDGFSPDTDVLYVGSLKANVDPSEQDEVAQRLLDEFNCVPTFLPPELHEKFYYGFSKQYLWPLFHYMLPIFSDSGNRYDPSQWKAYVSANRIFANKIKEVITPDVDYVWIHDYHLMVVPLFLRKCLPRVKLGFFLHSPFPSSEIYCTLPVRSEILKGLLNADLIGFHTFDYARHFLYCCSKLLGLEYESKRGYIGLEYLGRTVYIKILAAGVHMGQLESALNHPSTTMKLKELREQFNGKKVILGVDDMDIFKGISLKVQAMEELLKKHSSLKGEVVLVQIINPARGTGKDVEMAKEETYLAAAKVNQNFGTPGYQPVVLIDRSVPLHEKTAYYAIADCCIVNALRDGMNLMPYKYIVCRQGTPNISEALGIDPDCPSRSALVISEFIGCSPSLSGAIRVNPWDVVAVAEALLSAITMNNREKEVRHDKHYRYISSHDVAYWARSFIQDLERSCKDHDSKKYYGMGLGLNFRTLALPSSFSKLSVSSLVHAYKRNSHRVIFLDYDGTLVPQPSHDKSPSPAIISYLNCISSDPKNTVFIVSGRERGLLNGWLGECKNLGIAAEHGYFMRWRSDSAWETSSLAANFGWKSIAEPVIKLYTETTDGSYIESKESALVWHYEYAGPDFGTFQAKEMLNHLENVLSKEPVEVKRGNTIVEVKPQGITKGLVAEKVLADMISNGKVPDFVLCIGDDRSDEDMFETLEKAQLPVAPEMYACTVGQKPSKARYYLESTWDVGNMLEALADVSQSERNKEVQVQVRPNSTI